VLVWPVRCSCGHVELEPGIAAPARCIHLPPKGEPGLVVRCGGCGGRTRRVPVFACPIVGLTVEHVPTLPAGGGAGTWTRDEQAGAWTGSVCSLCSLREVDEAAAGG